MTNFREGGSPHPWAVRGKALLNRVKACVHYFLNKFLLFPKGYSFKNYERWYLFHLNSSFPFWEIQIFVFPSSCLFVSVSHYLRAWFKVNLQSYDVIDCLNKNLIKQFIWYPENENRYDSETLSVDRVLNKKHFYWKCKDKMCTKS